jgi:hypothetical protein
MNEKTTFLNVDLKDEVYMTQLKVFINNSQIACKSKKKLFMGCNRYLIGDILFTRLLLHCLLKTLLINIYTLRSVGLQ